ncbi:MULTISPECIES: type II secretion system minor pseudopilin GspI [Pseudomonas]|uniref:type II secretion system minor pseudopilin GspI n=1 Tax=Pseudomonas TaxID=286 RepID=UPI001BEC5717|nr:MULTISPECIES: type II secretion system minor pseudopilin GspI [Pseudomonas]MBT2341609.1 type II secretion system minor pseudopilin GspI [Pseudomonas fluorescens]MCD4531078.1 type II secretion system minor pseudopilin GspI [Pseudomonas sp. C3-2018]
MPRPAPQAGFTLIEVLVALAIIAVAMSAAVRVAAVMTQSNGLLRDKSIALLAARSQLAQLRLEQRFAPGMKVFECDQGRLLLRCEQTLRPAENARLLRVELTVSDRSHEAPPLARLETLVVREK